jgi:hypothetical protein
MVYTKSISTFLFISIVLSISQAQNVGINILNPEFALEIKSINDRVFKLISRQDLLLMEVNDQGNFGINTTPTGGSASLLIKPGNLTTNAEEVLAVRDANNLSILSVEEQRRVGILTESPLTKLHVEGGNGNTTSQFGDFAIGNSLNAIRMGIYTAGGNQGRASIEVNGNGVKQLSLRAGSGGSLINFDGLNHKIGVGFTTVPETYFHIKRGINYDVKFESSTGDVDLIIDGKSGTNGIEFQNDGVFQGSFGYDATVDRLFMYAGGNVMYAKNGNFYFPHLANNTGASLHVTSDGEVVTDADIYDFWTYGAMEFLHSLNADQNINNLDIELIVGSVTGSPDVGNPLYCPVKIKHGANLKKIKIFYGDDHGSKDLNVQFYRLKLDQYSGNSILDFISSGSAGGIRTFTQTINHIIDNENYYYYLRVVPTSGSWASVAGTLRIRGVQFSEDPNF